MTQGSTVLVTGATGFIGRRVVRELAGRGYDVHAVARAAPAWATPGLRWHTADLLDPVQGRAVVTTVRPELLVHLAWNAMPGRFWTDPDNLDWVAGSLALVRSFAAGGGRRAVFAGTCAEYDWGHACLDETATPLVPHTLYGQAKDALRRLVAAASGPLGLSAAWGRVFFLYGPDEAPRRLVSDIVDGIARGVPVDCSAGTQLRDFMHADDVARAFVEVLESAVTGPVNIASGVCRPIRDLITLLAEGLGRPDLVRLGARPLPPGDPPELRAATRILSQDVGFQPRFTLEQGVADLVRELREAATGHPGSRLEI